MWIYCNVLNLLPVCDTAHCPAPTARSVVEPKVASQFLLKTITYMYIVKCQCLENLGAIIIVETNFQNWGSRCNLPHCFCSGVEAGWVQNEGDVLYPTSFKRCPTA